MLRLLRWPAMAGVAVLVSGCATMNVSSHVERGLDFTQYTTWEWAPPDALQASDARLDNPFFRDHYHANLSPQRQVNTAVQSFGACYDKNCTVRVLDNRTKFQARLQEAVTRMFGRFPRSICR